MFIKRLISSLCLWGLIAALVYFKFEEGTFLLIAVLGLVGQWEFYLFQEGKGQGVFKRFGTFWGASFFAVLYGEVFLFKEHLDGGEGYVLEILVLLTLILLALSRQVFEKDQQGATSKIALTLLGFFYIPYLFSFVTRILFWEGEDFSGFYLVVYLVAVTKFTDVGAYIAGKLFGRHKMSPVISPKKTWEGFVGGVLLALGVGVGLIELFPDELGLLNGGDRWVLGILLPLVSVIGDLAESVIKRDADKKDSGGVIPGIGGILDLIDSLLFTAPFFFAYLVLFVK